MVHPHDCVDVVKLYTVDCHQLAAVHVQVLKATIQIPVAVTTASIPVSELWFQYLHLYCSKFTAIYDTTLQESWY